MPTDEEIILLHRKLDRHIDEYRLHILEEQKREERLDRLIDSTQGLVDSWVFAMSFRKFIIFASAFSVPAAAVFAKFKGWI
jgi:hypothetical protein